MNRINENWVRLWITKTIRSWEVLVGYDYKTYSIKNTATGDIKEICLFDVKTPSIENIREGLKCQKVCL